MTPNDEVEATVYRVLRATFVKVLVHPLRAAVMTENQKTELVEQHRIAFDEAFRALCLCMEQGRTVAVEHYRARLHTAEGVDHEMVDEAAEFALR